MNPYQHKRKRQKKETYTPKIKAKIN